MLQVLLIHLASVCEVESRRALVVYLGGTSESRRRLGCWVSSFHGVYATQANYNLHNNFLDDIEDMLKWRPPVVYKYLWKYVCLLAMIGLLAASLLRMVLKGPTYTAWNESTASEMTLEYPGWALVMIVLLIVFASLPVPVSYVHSTLQHLRLLNSDSMEGAGKEVNRDLYTKCSSVEQLDFNSQQATTEEEGVRPRTTFLPVGSEHYRLLPQKEDLDEEDQDTGV